MQQGQQEKAAQPQEVEIQEAEYIPGRNGGRLRRWPKGQCGNPAGPPAGRLHFRTILKRMLKGETEMEVNGKVISLTKSEAIILRLIDMATSRDSNDIVALRAIAELIDRIDGKPLQQQPDTDETAGTEAVVFYIPNQHSRIRQAPDEE